jgi:hypothetical protein
MIYPHVKFELNVCNCYLDNEQKTDDDGRMEWQKRVTLYAPAILWWGHIPPPPPLPANDNPRWITLNLLLDNQNLKVSAFATNIKTYMP